MWTATNIQGKDREVEKLKGTVRCAHSFEPTTRNNYTFILINFDPRFCLSTPFVTLDACSTVCFVWVFFYVFVC